MKFLIAGDIVGAPGRKIFARVATQLKSAGKVDCIVANAENAAGGNGLNEGTANELFAAGADVLTLGDHAWDQKDLIPYISSEPRIIRPANFAPGCPGKGFYTFEHDGRKITVMNLIGRVFMNPYDCPFRKADEILRLRKRHDEIILVDMHAEATSEKITMGHYLDGRVSAVFGTHTHVPTADEQILPNGTGYLTDLGMCGPSHSSLGRELEPVTQRFLTGMPIRFPVAKGPVVFNGLILNIENSTGRCKRIKRYSESSGS